MTMVLMPYRRRTMQTRSRPMRAPIISFKHQHSDILTYVGGNANNEFEINVGTSQVSPVTSLTTPLGNKHYSVDISVNFVNNSTTTATDWGWFICHLRQDQTVTSLYGSSSSANWSVLGAGQGKNQIIVSYMGTTSSINGSMYNFTRHIRIPKLWNRVRDGDKLVLVWNSAQAGVLAIGARFKTYS